MEIKKCLCDEICFSYHNLSTNIKYYKCKKLKQKRKCGFLYIDDSEKFTDKQLKSIKIELNQIKNKSKLDIKYHPIEKQSLKDLGMRFLSNQKVSTLHEIENMSHLYINEGEDVLEYIERVCFADK